MSVKLRLRPGKGWYVFTDWNGQRKAKFFGKDQKLAQAFANKLTARLKWAEQSGETFTLATKKGTVPTVMEYLTEWLGVYADAHCKPSTASGYRIIVKHHLIPALGNRRLDAVSRTDIKRLIAQWLNDGKAKQTIHNILTPFKEAYQHAIDDGLVTANPVSNMARALRSRESADAHIDPLTAKEVRMLLQKAKETAPLFYPIFLCAVRTGMRQGELLGLQWGDVDFHGQFIEVRRAIVMRQETTTKTHKIRRVDMSPQLAQTLKALKETRVLEAGIAEQRLSEWIFLGPTRQRMSNELVRKAFRSCLTAAELRQVRFHDLRHTFASLLIQQGANPKYVQQQLGHGSISITLDIYSHLFQGDHQHHVHQLDDAQEPVVRSTEFATQAQPEEAESKAGSWEPIDVLQEKIERRGDGVAERAGLENRRWGNPSASSNLAPSASESGVFCQVLRMMENWPTCRDIGGVDSAKRLSQRGDWAGVGVLSLGGFYPV